MKRITRIAVALLAVLVLFPVGLARSESVKAYVSSTTLKIYKDYSTSADVMCVISYGEMVYCTAAKGDWARVKNCDGETGYCHLSGLTTSNPNRYSVTAYVQSDDTRIYRGASTDTDSAGLDQNTKVTVIAGTGDAAWCRVKIQGIYGYIKTGDLATTKVKDATAIQTGSVAVYVSDNTLTVYASPSTSADSATIGFGEKLTCVAVGGDWAKVKSGDYVAYCKTSGLSTENPNAYSSIVYAQSSSVKVRKLPSSSASTLATVGTNTSMTAIAVTSDGKWYRVKGGGEYGYVLASNVDTDKVTASKSTSKATQIISLAYEQIGDPYVYAAAGPNAFDCSGLTCYCFRKVCGITLGRSAKAQGYDNSYKKISDIADLRKGDIVCFDTNDGDGDLSDHVGIYMGGGRFIHASSAGGEVMVSSLTSGYYRSAFSWGRRVLD
jgi:cell wall-associated NlpC family hydrolase